MPPAPSCFGAGGVFYFSGWCCLRALIHRRVAVSAVASAAAQPQPRWASTHKYPFAAPSSPFSTAVAHNRDNSKMARQSTAKTAQEMINALFPCFLSLSGRFPNRNTVAKIRAKSARSCIQAIERCKKFARHCRVYLTIPQLDPVAHRRYKSTRNTAAHAHQRPVLRLHAKQITPQAKKGSA